MFRPQEYSFQNQRYMQWSPHLNSQGQFLPRNVMVNRYRYQNPSSLQNNYKFWCETCDKGFYTLDKLENHKLQHQKCNIDGCQFVAHPKIITKHIQMQHSTGLYKKIAKLNNPEEIKKWIEERKRKYPTKINIEKKAAEIKEKLERGEKMGICDKNYRKKQKTELPSRLRHKTGTSKFQSRKPNLNKLGNKINPKTPYAKRVCENIILTDGQKLSPFTGIQHLLLDDNTSEDSDQSPDSLIEDEVFNEELTNDMNIPSCQSEPSVCGALSSLICNYGSSDEEIAEECNVDTSNISLDPLIQSSEKVVLKETITEKSDLPYVNNNNDKSDNDSGPEETVISKTPTDNITSKDCDNNVETKKEKTVKVDCSIRQTKKPKYNLPSTLLVKLLSREIEQERNIILQCVRYVVKNNYFSSSLK
ncbi:FMR1-interacting protein NUFIP1 [Battus philenor]|uniref:FMR1-interacting protein NUFIP1 n=1 Tax=Battus philenor TaxID=42288 RepID=UPI0035CFAEE4